MRYISATAVLLTLGGCTGAKSVKHTEPIELNEENRVYYQAFDEKWAHDPAINPIFTTKAEAANYAKLNNMGYSHSYEVREIGYRYEVRVAFTDYTYSNGTWNDTLYTADDFNDAYEYVVEYSSAHSDLVIYDLKTGEAHEETP